MTQEEKVIALLTPSMRTALLNAVKGREVEETTWLWFSLRNVGVLDQRFRVTPFAWRIAHAVR